MATSGDKIPAKEWFTLGCRLFGMWQLLVAATYVISAFNVAAKFYPPGSSLGYSFGAYTVHVFAHFFLAAWLSRLARLTRTASSRFGQNEVNTFFDSAEARGVFLAWIQLEVKHDARRSK